MKKNTYRYLGIGFLLSALLTAGFETLVRGNPPLEGMSVQAIFNNNETALKEKESEISQLNEEQASLNQEIKTLQQDKDKLEKSNKENQDEIESLQKANASLVKEYGGDTDESTDETTDENNSQENQNNGEQTVTIPEGLSSAEIGQLLLDQGIITDAQALQDLIDTWELNEYIQANDYQLSADMSLDEILSIITNGAYYY
ncbi:hypothetical protein ACWOA0_00645 [Ignavigranum ruoffiae]|uniref:hypothetical protein n=1 Tax=Ignavigranum ruoffiae TaxID=89093 RepID=UPI002069D11C|nr:hypothetical protein [Ignavigranum ruoffiae]UPQ85629.1 hypothetical protein M0R79_08250 [Ignavigranum ruoffiae]